MADSDPKTIKTVFDFLTELAKLGSLYDAWCAGKGAALNSTGLSPHLKQLIRDADDADNLEPVRRQVQKEKGSAVVCLYVK